MKWFYLFPVLNQYTVICNNFVIVMYYSYVNVMYQYINILCDKCTRARARVCVCVYACTI